MTEEQLKKLKVGDIICRKTSRDFNGIVSEISQFSIKVIWISGEEQSISKTECVLYYIVKGI